MNETSDWDHKIISKAFTEKVNKKNMSFIYGSCYRADKHWRFRQMESRLLIFYYVHLAGTGLDPLYLPSFFMVQQDAGNISQIFWPMLTW